MLWFGHAMVVMNLTLSGIKYKISKSVTLTWRSKAWVGIMMNKNLDLHLLSFQI